jgi:hypothetical protein
MRKNLKKWIFLFKKKKKYFYTFYLKKIFFFILLNFKKLILCKNLLFIGWVKLNGNKRKKKNNLDKILIKLRFNLSKKKLKRKIEFNLKLRFLLTPVV